MVCCFCSPEKKKVDFGKTESKGNQRATGKRCPSDLSFVSFQYFSTPPPPPPPPPCLSISFRTPPQKKCNRNKAAESRFLSRWRARGQQREKLHHSVAAASDGLDGADHLLAHRLEHRDDELLALVKVLLDLHRELLGVVGALGQGEVVLGVSRVVHEGDEAVFRDVDQGVVLEKENVFFF